MLSLLDPLFTVSMVLWFSSFVWRDSVCLCLFVCVHVCMQHVSPSLPLSLPAMSPNIVPPVCAKKQQLNLSNQGPLLTHVFDKCRDWFVKPFRTFWFFSLWCSRYLPFCGSHRLWIIGALSVLRNHIPIKLFLKAERLLFSEKFNLTRYYYHYLKDTNKRRHKEVIPFNKVVILGYDRSMIKDNTYHCIDQLFIVLLTLMRMCFYERVDFTWHVRFCMSLVINTGDFSQTKWIFVLEC